MTSRFVFARREMLAPQWKYFTLTGPQRANKPATVDNELLRWRPGLIKEEIVERTCNPDWSCFEQQREDLIKRVETALG
ncbi:MAG: hypothetical protein KDK08_00735 [Rhizobiaceae bacterium]|nr:hypothetical protein [Rhizobiaceae bacterium]